MSRVTTEPLRGQSSDFDSFYLSQYSKAVRLARLLVDTEATAEELVQDSFVELLRRWESVEAPPAYLRSAIINRARSWGRRRALERRHSEPAPVISSGPDVDDALTVRKALRRLSPRQRAAVVLRYYEDLSESDIAGLLGCRPGTVKSLLSRGLRTMKEELDVD